MGDDIDRAQAYDEFFRGLALKNQGVAQPPASHSVTLCCVDCEEEIPEARRRAQPGCIRCLACQKEFEIHTHWRVL